MANMSAAILRNIIGSLFQVETRTVRLSGAIAPDSSWQNRYWNGSMGSDQNVYNIYGYSPSEGLVSLDIVGEYSGSNYAHTERTDIEGKPLFLVENVERFAFFVVRETGYSNWSGQEYQEWDNITLFSAPECDFNRTFVAYNAYKTAIELGLRYCEAQEIKEAIIDGDASDFLSSYEFVGRQWLDQERDIIKKEDSEYPYCISTEFSQYVCFAEQAGIIDRKHFLYSGWAALYTVSC